MKLVCVRVCNVIWNDLTSLQVTTSLRPSVFCPLLYRCIFFCVFLFIEKANWPKHRHTYTPARREEIEKSTLLAIILSLEDRVSGVCLCPLYCHRGQTREGFQLLRTDNGALGGGQDWQSKTRVEIEGVREVILLDTSSCLFSALGRHNVTPLHRYSAWSCLRGNIENWWV